MTMKNTKRNAINQKHSVMKQAQSVAMFVCFLLDDSFYARSLDVNAGLELKQRAGFHTAEGFVLKNDICTG